jgi:hypothetical protein
MRSEKVYYLSQTRISTMTRIKVERMLPRRGQIMKAIGARVVADDVVAVAEAPGPTRLIDVAKTLALRDRDDLEKYLQKSVGVTIGEGELLAAHRGAIPFTRRSCRAPVAGQIVAVRKGWVALQEQAPPFQLRALVSGVISNVMPSLGVVIEVTGSLIEGAWGMGEETHGVIRVVAATRKDPLGVAAIDVSSTGAVIVGGAALGVAALRQAEQVRVRGIIVGSMDAAILNLTPPPTIPIVVTEGFGSIPMSSAVFDLLKERESQEVSINTKTQLRWGLIRPQIIVSSIGEARDELHAPGVLEVGDTVRVLRQPYIGQTGRVKSFPRESQLLESGLRLPGVEVDLEDGPAFVPALNLEVIR